MAIAQSNKLDKTQATTFMTDFFDTFQDVLNRQTPINIKDLEKIMSPEFKISNNMRSVAKNLKEYLNRAELLRKKYSQFSITDIHVEPLLEDNKLVVSYNLNLTGRDGQKKLVHIMAIATIENHKISKWVEVTNVEDSMAWDK